MWLTNHWLIVTETIISSTHLQQPQQQRQRHTHERVTSPLEKVGYLIEYILQLYTWISRYSNQNRVSYRISINSSSKFRRKKNWKLNSN